MALAHPVLSTKMMSVMAEQLYMDKTHMRANFIYTLMGLTLKETSGKTDIFRLSKYKYSMKISILTFQG